ncbi:hypothetical protein ACMFLR_28245, partial [Delftia tsuruhatensis]|uniref:hypothetical protein n=1 Tax=Delftia tsuruhatensis TaxID=180282 RepID=UPI0039BCBC5E
MRGVLFVGGIVGCPRLAVAHVLDVAHHIGFHAAGRLGAELVHHHAHHGAHGIAQVGTGVLQVGHGLGEQRFGLGVGLLVEGQAGAELARATEQLTQPIDGSGQARAGILRRAGQGLTRSALHVDLRDGTSFQSTGVRLCSVGALAQARHVDPGITILFHGTHGDAPAAIRIGRRVRDNAVMRAVLASDDVARREIGCALGFLRGGLLCGLAARLGLGRVGQLQQALNRELQAVLAIDLDVPGLHAHGARAALKGVAAMDAGAHISGRLGAEPAQVVLGRGLGGLLRQGLAVRH